MRVITTTRHTRTHHLHRCMQHGLGRFTPRPTRLQIDTRGIHNTAEAIAVVRLLTTHPTLTNILIISDHKPLVDTAERADGYGGFAGSFWLNEAHRLARNRQVEFRHIPGELNPADTPSRTATGHLKIQPSQHTIAIVPIAVPSPTRPEYMR